MITVERLQTALATIKQQNRRLRRLVERKQRLNPYQTAASELDAECEEKGERPVFACPELDAVLASTDFEAEMLVLGYRLE